MTSRLSQVAFIGVVIALQGVIAQAQIRDIDLSRTYRPGGMDFIDTLATSSLSVSVNQPNQGPVGLLVNTQSILSDPLPWSNLQGSAIGDATYLGYTQDNFTVVFNYMYGQNPSPSTRLQYSYDFPPRVTDGANGFRRLDFSAQTASNVAGGLMELELIIEGQWTLSQQTTGGLQRELILWNPNAVWNIEQDFVYDPQTDITRFYAWRVSAGGGINESLRVVGYLIGAPVPAPSVAAAMFMLGCIASPRRRFRSELPLRS